MKIRQYLTRVDEVLCLDRGNKFKDEDQNAVQKAKAHKIMGISALKPIISNLLKLTKSEDERRIQIQNRTKKMKTYGLKLAGL